MNLDEEKRQFGKALAGAMARSGMRQVDAAGALGIGQTTISSWIRGLTQPSEPELTFALERALGLQPGELSKHLGYVPLPDESWLELLARDPGVDDELKRLLPMLAEALKGVW